jgi:hypothetical protein
MRKVFYHLFFISCSILNCYGQVFFEKEYGGTVAELGFTGEPTFDSGYFMCGATSSYGAGDFDIYLVKTNSSGDTLWTGVYGSSNRELYNSARQTSDSGFIAVTTIEDSAANYIACAIRLNATGDIRWVKTYHFSSYQSGAHDARETSDHGFIIAAGAYDGYYVVRTDTGGNVLWSKTYKFSTYFSIPYEIVETSDSGFIIVGTSYDENQSMSFQDVFVVKINASGNLQWAKRYQGSAGEVGTSIVQTFDGGYMIGGYTSSFGAGSTDAMLIKLTATGDTLWTRTFGGSDIEYENEVRQTPDSGYISVGSSVSFGSCSYLIKTDMNGDTVWTKGFGGTSTAGESIALTPDNGYFVTGRNNLSISLYATKMDSEGNSGCPVTRMPTVVSRAPFQVISQSVNVFSWTSVDSVPQFFMTRNGGQNTVCCIFSDTITVSGVADFCEGDSVELTTDTLINSYHWNTGDTSRSITVTQSGIYFVTVTDSKGCSATSNSVFITTNPLPVVNFTGLPDSVCADWNPITLQGNPPGGVFSGAGIVDSIFNPAAASTGLNQITYSFTDSLGCSNSFMDSVFVDICLGTNSPGLQDLYVTNPCFSKASLIIPSGLDNSFFNVFDQTGRWLFTQNISGIETIINLEKYSEGIYIVQVSTSRFTKALRLMKIK